MNGVVGVPREWNIHNFEHPRAATAFNPHMARLQFAFGLATHRANPSGGCKFGAGSDIDARYAARILLDGVREHNDSLGRHPDAPPNRPGIVADVPEQTCLLWGLTSAGCWSVV